MGRPADAAPAESGENRSVVPATLSALVAFVALLTFLGLLGRT
jgi:hypothetical protein